MPLKPYKKPEGRARYLLPQMNFVDPGAEAKTQRPKLPTRGLGVVGIDVDDEIKKRRKAEGASDDMETPRPGHDTPVSSSAPSGPDDPSSLKYFKLNAAAGEWTPGQ